MIVVGKILRVASHTVFDPSTNTSIANYLHKADLCRKFFHLREVVIRQWHLLHRKKFASNQVQTKVNCSKGPTTKQLSLFPVELRRSLRVDVDKILVLFLLTLMSRRVSVLSSFILSQLQ